MSIEESRERLEQAEKEIRADQDRQSRLLTDEYKDVVERLENWAYEEDNPERHLDLQTLALLKRYREGLEVIGGLFALCNEDHANDENFNDQAKCKSCGIRLDEVCLGCEALRRTAKQILGGSNE